jgi:hypothetical protein
MRPSRKTTTALSGSKIVIGPSAGIAKTTFGSRDLPLVMPSEDVLGETVSVPQSLVSKEKQ